MDSSWVVRPIGFVRSPFKEKADAPRQGVVAGDVAATIELLAEYKDALSDLEGFERIWVLFWFHRADGWKPKVLPPRSEEKRGVFATRAPHRPNPIGMTAVRLQKVNHEELTLHVREIDLIDQTPVIDIKPYIPYADAFPDSTAGWLEAKDAKALWLIEFSAAASERLAWIAKETKLDLRERITSSLSLGPQPHAYRRIKETDDGKKMLAVKEWRALFEVDDGDPSGAPRMTVTDILSGYRARDLAEGTEPVHELHRRFVAAFS